MKVRTYKQFPQDWALTQNNLGKVLMDLGVRSSRIKGIRYLQKSVAAFENALTVLTPKYYRAKNKEVQSSLEKSKQLLREVSRKK